MSNEPLGETIRRVLRDAPFAMRQLAADAGLSYDVLRSWRSGRRRPSRSSAQRLAEGLERRGQQLLALARELRAATAAPAETSKEPAQEPPSGGASWTPDGPARNPGDMEG
jgi:transcriptional regulator with XRE-family HTH domain